MATADDRFWQRLLDVAASSIAGLDPVDRAERIAYCRATGAHGISAGDDCGDLALFWGGRRLATVPRALFADDALDEPLTHMFVPEAPDDLSELT